MRISWVAGAIAASVFATAGCDDRKSPYFGTTERPGKSVHTFYVNNGSEPEYLDPGKSHDSASATLCLQLYEGLTVYDPVEARPVQGVATHWDQSDDNRLFRFYLRKDAKWSDGVPVTAHDFVYAWKRALAPETASQSAPNLYPLLNGELYNLSRLKVASGEVTVTTGPGQGQVVGKHPKGTAFAILARSPMKVATEIAPLAEEPAGLEEVLHDPPDPKAKTPEKLVVGERALGPGAGGGWKGKDVVVLARGAPVMCNGATDHFFTVALGDERGVLPGCLLAPSSAEQTFALVARHERLPTFRDDAAPAPPGGAAPEPVALGFVDEASLEVDDAVLGVKAADDHTLLVELGGPTPFFTDVTSHTTLMPVRRDVIEPFDAKGEPDMWTRPESIVTNGPYMLKEHKFRYEITMTRNPHYHDHDKLKIHDIVWLEVEEYHSTMNLYKAGDIDYIGENLSLPPEYMDFLSTKKDFYRTDYLSTYWYEFNTRTPPVDDVRVRQALNLAVDKRQLIDKITRAAQTPATHYVPPFTGLGYADAVKADAAAGSDPFHTKETEFNPERARELLGEAGYAVTKEGDGYRVTDFPNLEILYNTSEGHKKIAVAIQDMWKRHLGITASIRNEEWKVMLKNVRDRNFVVVRMGWVGDYNHPHTWLDTFISSSPQNRTGWADREFDELVRRAAATADRKESIRLYRQAEKRAVDGMAKMPLYFYTKSSLVKPYVKGWYGNARDTHLVKWMWIDPDWRSGSENVPAYPPAELPPPGKY